MAGGGADLEGQGADRHRVRPDAAGPGAVHLSASGGQPGLYPGAAGPEGHRYRVRDGTAEQRRPAAAGPDERGSWPARATGRGVSPDAAGRRSRHPDERCLGCLRRQGGGDRCWCLGHERRGDRARHAGRSAVARPQHRPTAGGGPDLPGASADHRLQCVRGRARCAGRRSGDRRRAGPGRQGADLDQQRARLANALRQCSRRHRHRPRRLLRGQSTDHACRADLPSAQIGVLLRGQHAGRSAQHLDLCADQCHASVRAQPCQQRLA